MTKPGEVDKCGCGRWKNVVAPKCRYCAAARASRTAVLRRQLFPNEYPVWNKGTSDRYKYRPQRPDKPTDLDDILDAAFEKATGRRPWS